MQMVLMGSGDEEYVGLLRALEDAYPGRVVAYVGYNTELEHKVRVGATSEPRWRAHGCADASLAHGCANASLAHGCADSSLAHGCADASLAHGCADSSLAHDCADASRHWLHHVSKHEVSKRGGASYATRA